MTTLITATAALLAALATVCTGSLDEVSGRVTLPPRQGVGSDPGAELRSLASALNIGTHAGLRQVTNDLSDTGKGVKRCRLDQTYAGYEVFGAGIEAETDLDGHITGQFMGLLASNLEEDIPDPEACPRNIQDILAIAMAHDGYTPPEEDIIRSDGRKVIYVDPDTGKATLAYRVEYYFQRGADRSWPTYFINACDDSVLLDFNQVKNLTLSREERAETFNNADCQTTTRRPTGNCSPYAYGLGGNPKTGRRQYGSDGLCMPVTPIFGRCTMESTYVKVVDNGNTRDTLRQTAVSFTCNNGYSDARNGAYGVASDAYYYGHITGRLYQEKYSYRALSWKPRMVVHYDRCYDNAFWDGRDMYFGDGCTTFYPLVSQDVIAHELAHGITSTNSRLVYRYESGGINEAFSDISGEAAELFGGRSGGNDFNVGFDLFKSASRSLRYFRRPEDDGRSVSTIGQYYTGMDVHYSSGIFNIAFYRMVEEQNMDLYQAYGCFLHANRNLWTTRSTFQAGACAVIKACYDLGYDHNKARTAFQPTGLNVNSCNLLTLSVQIAAGTTREQVMVSTGRSPILELDVTGATGKITAAAEDFSTVTIDITTDVDGQNVVASGENEVTFSVQSGVTLFAKFSSNAETDQSVTVTFS
ncbi:hypothetical protein EGW08_018134 [Elysia chlorotica]|uniref:Neutral metalloproteinase n=1 Tax=Elysia chlorotica TaxID=188477 RepID=A0A433SXP6_ELYCH|nr:hypothetical protein EGW08_018134 [Elysia chlorotica]